MNSRDGNVPASADETATEQLIQREGATKGPRLTPDKIDALIVREDYHVFPGTTVTVCLLELKNGYCVTGEAAAASPENFSVKVGRDVSRRNARDKIWGLEGYLLRERFHLGQL